MAPASNVGATFSEALDPSTISDVNGASTTFTLLKQGSTTPVAATVAYDAAAKKATLDPSTDLEAGAVYTATVKGGSGGVKDVAGNPLGADKAWTFTTAAADTTPPDTIIDSGPSGTVTSSKAKFYFHSTEPNSTFRCSLDSTQFSACTSPKQYTGLANGPHTFQVYATDAAGNRDLDPASSTWTVQR